MIIINNSCYSESIPAFDFLEGTISSVLVVPPIVFDSTLGDSHLISSLQIGWIVNDPLIGHAETSLECDCRCVNLEMGFDCGPSKGKSFLLVVCLTKRIKVLAVVRSVSNFIHFSLLADVE